MGDWLRTNGDAIYGSRYWKINHQANAHLAFTTNGKKLYAIALQKPTQPFTIEASAGWKDGVVESVRSFRAGLWPRASTDPEGRRALIIGLTAWHSLKSIATCSTAACRKSRGSD